MTLIKGVTLEVDNTNYFELGYSCQKHSREFNNSHINTKWIVYFNNVEIGSFINDENNINWKHNLYNDYSAMCRKNERDIKLNQLGL